MGSGNLNLSGVRLSKRFLPSTLNCIMFSDGHLQSVQLNKRKGKNKTVDMRGRAAWALRSFSSVIANTSNIPCYSTQLPRLASIDFARFSSSTSHTDPSDVLRVSSLLLHLAPSHSKVPPPAPVFTNLAWPFILFFIMIQALHGAEFQHHLEQLRKQFGVMQYNKLLEQFKQR